MIKLPAGRAVGTKVSPCLLADHPTPGQSKIADDSDSGMKRDPESTAKGPVSWRRVFEPFQFYSENIAELRSQSGKYDAPPRWGKSNNLKRIVFRKFHDFSNIILAFIAVICECFSR